LLLAAALFPASGRRRWAHVYLPSSYDGSKRFPLWVHLHGVFWNTMSNIAQKVCPAPKTVHSAARYS